MGNRKIMHFLDTQQAHNTLDPTDVQLSHEPEANTQIDRG